jgi:cell division protein FtsA
MTMDMPPIAAIEVGTSQVRVLIGEIREDGSLQVLGIGECPSRGVRKSELIDFDAALTCLKIALHQAEENADVEVESAYLAVTGGHIQSVVNRGMIPIVGHDLEIDREHMESVLDMAKAVNLPGDREVIHNICQFYYLDDQRGVVNPLGMEASRLSADVLIVHGNANRMRNLVKLVRTVPIEIDSIALGPLVTGLAVLSPEEKELGVLVIDLGGGTTDYLAYADGAIAATGSLAVGGDHVTNDIAKGLNLALADAERVKAESGSAVVDLATRLQRLDLPADTGPAGRIVKRGDLHTITHLRAEETLTMVKAALDKGDLLQRFGAGVVLTGGGARLSRMTDLTEKVFGLGCRVGRAREISGLASLAGRPECATIIGLLRYAARTREQMHPRPSRGGLLGRLFGGGGEH